jgi:hypothetical protein
MILPFSTEFPNGEPTHFVEKIWTSLFPICDIETDEWVKKMQQCSSKGFGFGSPKVKDFLGDVKPKRHTLREDKTNRWKVGNKIHPVVFNRSKNQFQFTPIIECKSIQNIEIINHSEYMNDTEIIVDGHTLDIHEMQRLAWNDGFDNLIAFHLYFQEDFKGKIIHWTDIKY